MTKPDHLQQATLPVREAEPAIRRANRIYIRTTIGKYVRVGKKAALEWTALLPDTTHLVTTTVKTNNDLFIR